MAPTDSARSDARERIMVATYDLVSEAGLGSVTMTAIADRANVARQTLYNHFTDVEQIVIAGIEEYNTTGLIHLTELLTATTTAEAKLELLARHSVAASNHRQLGTNLRTALSTEAQARLDHHAASFRSLIESILAEGVDDGSFDESLDPVVYAVLVESLLLAAADLAAETDDPAGAASVTTAAVLNVVGAHPGS